MRLFIRDTWRFSLLLFVAAAIGLTGNSVRKAPLPLVYQSRSSRLEQQVQAVSEHSRAATPSAREALTNASVTIISLAEFQQYAEQKEALLLDARPGVFYGLGHVPRALSLPRDDFEAAYVRLKSQLEVDRGRPLAVYCSDTDCQDSELVANALLRLGYSRVLRFKDGWTAWQNAHLPEEKVL